MEGQRKASEHVGSVNGSWLKVSTQVMLVDLHVKWRLQSVKLNSSLASSVERVQGPQQCRSGSYCGGSSDSVSGEGGASCISNKMSGNRWRVRVSIGVLRLSVCRLYLHHSYTMASQAVLQINLRNQVKKH